MFNTLKYTIDNTVRLTLLESKLNQLIYEEDNPAYDRRNANGDNVKALWNVIDKKQEELQNLIFGQLSNGLDDITREKAKAMGSDFLQVPKTICNAGNKKLPSSVLIINMSSSLMCPSYYLGICFIKNGACYAQRAENRLTNNVLPNRWKTDLMHTQMLQQYAKGNKSPMRKYFNLVETYIQLGNAYCTNLYRKELERMQFKLGRDLTKEEQNFLYIQQMTHKITDVRLNETGDFHCQLAVDLWAKFAQKIKKKYGIDTHAYTARNLDFSKASKVMAVNVSHEGINIGTTDERIFKAVPDKKYNSLVGGDKVVNRQPVLGFDKNQNVYFYKCPCGKGESKCDRCGVCFVRNQTGKKYVIYVRYHGQTSANGFKSLFKKNEIKATFEELYKNGWITQEEYDNYKSNKHQRNLARISRKIEKQRQNSQENK